MDPGRGRGRGLPSRKTEVDASGVCVCERICVRLRVRSVWCVSMRLIASCAFVWCSRLCYMNGACRCGQGLVLAFAVAVAAHKGCNFGHACETLASYPRHPSSSPPNNFALTLPHTHTQLASSFAAVWLDSPNFCV